MIVQDRIDIVGGGLEFEFRGHEYHLRLRHAVDLVDRVFHACGAVGTSEVLELV